MKKILTLGLAVLMIALAVASCKTTGNGGASSTPAASIPTPPASSSSQAKPTEPTPTESSTPASTVKPEVVTFEECDETVYVVGTEGGLWLRSSTSFDTDANKVALVDPGKELQRIGKHDTWSKVVYEGKEYFTSSRYLSTEKPAPETEPVITITFTECDETVYVTGGTYYVRSFPSTEEKYQVAALVAGTELKRTGIAYDTPNDPDGLGWSRVIYKGNVCYMRNSALSTKAPSAESTGR